MKPTFSFLILLSSVVSAWGITIETVPIGDTGNPNDPASARYVGQDLTLFGRVDYPYNIGKYEVTVGQYAEFLNAVARTDTYELYNIGMATDAISAGIARSGVNGNFTYQVIGSPKHPITYVGWGDAIRFAN